MSKAAAEALREGRAKLVALFEDVKAGRAALESLSSRMSGSKSSSFKSCLIPMDSIAARSSA